MLANLHDVTHNTGEHVRGSLSRLHVCFIKSPSVKRLSVVLLKLIKRGSSATINKSAHIQ